MIYIIGSLNGPHVEVVADHLRQEGIDAFDQWRAAKGDYWADYAVRRGIPFKEALAMDFAETAFQFDMKYLRACTAAVMVMPAGRSGGIELGWILGQGKPGYILYDGEPERPDLMAKLATNVFFNVEDLIKELHKNVTPVNIISKILPPNTWICPTCHQYSSIGGCSCYQRDIGHSGGNRTLTRSERLAILEEQDKL